MPYILTNKGIDSYNAVIIKYAFDEKTPKKDKEKLLEITEILDEILVAGGVSKE